jgi:glucose-6-phosphate-specific signal transduction histidine kinase
MVCAFVVVNLYVAKAVSSKYGWKVVILFAAGQRVSAFLASAFMHKFNWRTLFRIGGAVLAVVQAAIAALLYLNPTDTLLFILLTTSLCVIVIKTGVLLVVEYKGRRGKPAVPPTVSITR